MNLDVPGNVHLFLSNIRKISMLMVIVYDVKQYTVRPKRFGLFKKIKGPKPLHIISMFKFFIRFLGFETPYSIVGSI